VRLDDVAQDPVYLCTQGVEVAGVLQDMIGSRTLLVKRHLGFFAPSQLGGGPAAGGGPLDAKGERRGHEDDGIALVCKPGLEQERRVEDECTRAVRRRGPRGPAAFFDPRMRERLEPSPLLGVTEDDLRDGAAVHAAVVVQDALAPPLNERRDVRGILQRRACQLIRVAHEAAELGERGGNGRLAGADASSDADDRD
jgi:hypothetical protein